MLIRQVYIIQFIAVFILSMDIEVVGQETSDDFDIIAVRGIKRIYSLPNNENLLFFWSFKDCDGAIFLLEENSNKLEYVFEEEGEYLLSVYGKDKKTGCFSESLDIKVNVVESGFDVELGSDKWKCPGDTIELKAQVEEKHLGGNYDNLVFVWDGIAGNNSTIRVNERGTYKVKVIDKYGNSTYDEVNVYEYSSPLVDLGEDMVINKGESIILSASGDFNKYQWSTGEKEAEIEVESHGKYWITVTDENKCVASDTIRIFNKGETTSSGLLVSLPSAFSPNNDGVNDKLLARGDLLRIKKLTLLVYRKDGLKVFETNNINKGWDGKYRGELQKVDGYMYFLKVVFDTEEILIKKGSVLLLR